MSNKVKEFVKNIEKDLRGRPPGFKKSYDYSELSGSELQDVVKKISPIAFTYVSSGGLSVQKKYSSKFKK